MGCQGEYCCFGPGGAIPRPPSTPPIPGGFHLIADLAPPPVACHLGSPALFLPPILEQRPLVGVAPAGSPYILIGSGEVRPHLFPVSVHSSLHLPSSRKSRELFSYLLEVSPPIAVGVPAGPSGKCGLSIAGSPDGTGGRNYESPSGLARLLLGRIPDNAWFLSGPSGVAGVN